MQDWLYMLNSKSKIPDMPIAILVLIFGVFANAYPSANADAKLAVGDSKYLCEFLLTIQQSEWWKPRKPLLVKSSQKTYATDFYIGGSSATVFLDVKNNVVLKFYPKNNPLALYEQLVTEYLLGRGVRVPRVLERRDVEITQGIPEESVRLKNGKTVIYDFEPGSYTLVVKEYFEGITLDTMSRVENMDALRDRLSAHLETQGLNIQQSYFGSQPGKFLDWLKQNHPEAAQVLSKTNAVFTGDTKAANFVYLADEGWLLVDP